MHIARACLNRFFNPDPTRNTKENLEMKGLQRLRHPLRYLAHRLPWQSGRILLLILLLATLMLVATSCASKYAYPAGDGTQRASVAMADAPAWSSPESGSSLDEWIRANLRPRASRWNQLDPSGLHLHAASALIVDEYGNRLYSKNAQQIRPIASITKLMTAMVVLDAGAPMTTRIKIIEDDRDRLRNSRSRLRLNEAILSRREMITVSVMSSDNRAAHALARTTFRGGTPAFIKAMNRKAISLGMLNTHFADSSGLNGNNRSTAEDLVKLVKAAASYPLIREITEQGEITVRPFADGTSLPYRNSNPLVRTPDWQVEVSKTGFINESGYCLAMQARIDNRPVIVILLNASARWATVSDSNQVRDWLLGQNQAAGS
ncbi:D-alanyl-D-alanine carboxypeptidase [Thiorhodovibrio frisius]|uniref:D-alanyl-D-alanine carboxypeptidase n=2 Tax=Thiorhodovibrio frisius TaxID=631362 RepID=H8Z8R3_9GAMM|nr:D-alanyl-D-alanine carboxypeptidase [Thiorhodovibrio frisius]WPL22225.1 D-alanyl-D-alanine endopeptidase precursor [Thiorhodovibrio frisius]